LRRAFTWGIDHPRLAVSLVILLSLLSLWVLPTARFDPSPEQIYPHDSPQAQLAAAHRTRFGREDRALFLLRAGDPLDPAIEVVATLLAARPEVRALQSPARAELLHRELDGTLSTRPLKPGESHPWTDGLLVTEDGAAGVIVLELEPSHDDHSGRRAILTAIDEATAAAGGQWHISGMPAVRLSYVETMGSDLRTIVPLSLAVASIFFWLAFQDRRHVLLGVAAVGSGALIAAGAYAATGTPFNIFAAAFLTIVVVVGTSDLVHLVHRASDHFEELGDASSAARRAAEEVGLSCLLTSTTTAAGFFALLTTIIPPIRTFGVATGAGVLITYIVGFLLVPPALVWIGPPSNQARGHASGSGARMARLGRWTMRHWRGLLVVWGLLLAGCVAAATALQVDYRLLQHLEASHRLGDDHHFMEAHLGGVLPLEVSITLPSSALEPEALAAVSELTAWMRGQPAVGYALSLPDVLAPGWQVLSGESGLPPSREAAAQTALMIELAGRDILAGFVVNEADGSRSRIVARVRDVGHEETISLVEDLRVEAARLLGPLGGSATVTGIAYLIQEVNLTLTEQFAGSFVIALAAIGLMWLIGTRSPRRTLLALLPNGVPLLMMLAFMGLSGIALKPSTAMVMSIGLGIAVDDTIHFLAAYERARRRGDDVEDAITHAFSTAGRSMVDTSIMIGLGFGCLIFSRSPDNQSFGILAAWVVGCAVACDLFLLPPLLRWLDAAPRR
jgi:predicted RND superfamily exporter protein